MSKLLITGGAGFIGSYCVDRLLKDGYEVVVFDIKKSMDAVHLHHVMHRIQYIEGDIRVLSQLQAAVSDCEYILHLAAVVSVPESMCDPSGTFTTNVMGTLHVFEAAAKHEIKRVVYASSAAVYGDVTCVPTPESESHEPLSHYGMHKAANEQLAEWYKKQFGLATTGLRFFNVYGSRQDPNSPYSGVISIFAKLMRSGQVPTIYGDGTATRDFVHVHDVAAVCVFMLTATNPEAVYNVGTGRPRSLRELVDTLNGVLGIEQTPVYAPKREGDIDHSCAEVSRLRRQMPAQPWTDLVTGLAETIGTGFQDQGAPVKSE